MLYPKVIETSTMTRRMPIEEVNSKIDGAYFFKNTPIRGSSKTAMTFVISFSVAGDLSTNSGSPN